MLSEKVRLLQKERPKPVILVIGDLMVDHYIWGNATRLSPEAPVPVVSVQNEETTLGGAANVAQNLISLGAQVLLAGLIGPDQYGKELLESLSKENILADSILVDPDRKTTCKSRVLVGGHQIVRVDREVTLPIANELASELFDRLKPQIELADMVLLSDYNKGLFTPDLTRRLIQHCKLHQKKVIVDPKGIDYLKYSGAFIIKPNRKEIAEAVKSEKISTTEELKAAAHQLLHLTDIEHLVVTLSEEGMIIVNKDSYQVLPVKATEVFDVTGAGDTVLASIAYFLTLGLDLMEACELANYAAAVVIKRVGSASATIDEILKLVDNS